MSRTLGWFGLPFLNDIRLQHLETRWHNAMGLHPGLWVWSPVVQTYQSHGSQYQTILIIRFTRIAYCLVKTMVNRGSML